MPRVYLVRHGRPARGWGADRDPGLGDVGRAEAAAVADRLAPLGPLPLLTSPMRRARETAEPLARRWGVEPVVEPAVGEISAPVEGLAERGAWLEEALAGRWGGQAAEPVAWRDGVVDVVRSRAEDTVVVTHYVAVNAVVGVATGDDRVTCFHPATGSITVVDTDGERLTVVELGGQAAGGVT